MKKILLFLVLSLELMGFKIELNSNVTALKLEEKLLYVGTDEGKIFLFETKDLRGQNEDVFLKEPLVKLEKVQNYYEFLGAKIYHIDVLKNKMLILSEGDYGGKNLSIYEDKTLIKTKKLEFEGVSRAFFIDENTLLVGLIGSEIKLLNLDFKELKSFKFSHSSLNDLTLSEDKKRLVAGFESGEVELFDLEKWQILKNYNTLHKDNIYQVSYKNGVILSCGTDRRVGVINQEKQDFLQKDFLIYACALSPSGKIGAFSDNDRGITELFEIATLKSIKKFENLDMMSEFIIFLDDENLLISGFGKVILMRSL
ncbi:WD40 repeat domain-containing protein [Campylobacter helveticus]|uniref:WD40 repeat domain-containing protein n=1 Tax=Campylobacter helveticus TaxID=28898 RepID=UPI001046BA56|nr:WD40 repeat domain-containing protein [Campylobacter helveticus]MCR2057091.1 WD40 repeat domain-containing protein [Campylobacter helveticus]MCR2066325.1 WD40 repeat domain-containing protein [Campylobacter helveticus]QBL11349.1 WD40 repeat domain-containing protein [Campylobacter helveticus]TNB55309.1 WD40 repeat domain-containing protein [Campylobacter helveticus]